MAHAYVTINGVNLLNEYDMELVSYDTGVAVPAINLIDVPGLPGKLDATLALNGQVNYKTRTVTATFHIRDISYYDWMNLLSNLSGQFNGVEAKVVFSNDPDWYYRGRFNIAGKKENTVTGNVTILCKNAFPYKLEDVAIEETISGITSVTCVGRTYNSKIKIWSDAEMIVEFDGNSYAITYGDNSIPEIHFTSGDNVLTFTGTGNVEITYERGIL